MATRKRKVGAQSGNANALKHGFYSRKFRELESQDLDQVRTGLNDEIAMLRVTIRRVFDHASELGDTLEGLKQELREGGSPEAFAGLNVLSQSLSTLGIATTRLAHMLRTQKFLDGGSDDPLEELVLQAIESREYRAGSFPLASSPALYPQNVHNKLATPQGEPLTHEP